MLYIYALNDVVGICVKWCCRRMG